MKYPTSFRLPDLTTRQLADLIAATGMTQSEVVTTAIDRMYTKELGPMTTKQAATRIVRIDSKNERLELRAGAKGTGKVLWQCNYWPDSDRSVEEMDRMLTDFVRQNDIELTDTVTAA